MTDTRLAVWYMAEGYRSDGAQLMGRQVAGEAWLRAYAGDSETRELICASESRAQFEAFTAQVAGFGGEARPCRWLPLLRVGALAAVDHLFRPSPDIAPAAWMRRRGDQRACSLTGMFHTTASHTVMDGIAELLLGPLQPWDAVVCTSDAMRGMVVRLLDDQAAYLEARLGVAPRPAVRLPVIPLGVDCGRFAEGEAASAARADWRRRLGIGETALCALYLSRLSYHAKANPLPMLLGLERAATRTGVEVHLVQAGWFPNDKVRDSFRRAAADHAPSLRHHFLDGRLPEVRQGIWAAADLFTILSDNIQETFGLAPLEAMAAGLPVVASDWDGFRETVRDGIDGLLVPTAMARAGSGAPLAELYADGGLDYDLYVGAAAQSVAVDVEAATEAYAALLGDAELRRHLGAAGRQRAREVFDWPRVIAAYRTLWTELDELRASAPEVAARAEGAPVVSRVFRTLGLASDPVRRPPVLSAGSC